MELKAEDFKTFVVLAIFVVTVPVALLYVSGFCNRDWVVVGGLTLDVLGAFLLAAPDIAAFQENSYAGQLRTIREIVVIDPKERFISKRMISSDVFIEEMDKVFGGEQVSKDSIFKIKEMRENGHPVNYILIHQTGLDSDGQPISLSNVDRHFREKIESEDARVRRAGVILLSVGFISQILGLLVTEAPLSIGC